MRYNWEFCTKQWVFEGAAI